MDANRSVTANFSGLLGLGNNRRTDVSGDVDLGRLHRVVKSRGARGEVTLNGRVVLLRREGAGQIRVQAPPGNNLVEAWVREATVAGIWRFELDPAAIEPGSLRVLAGEPLAVA